MDTAIAAAWETVIGLEVHCQVRTATKMYCACRAENSSELSSANRHVCPLCLGHPGTLPRPNYGAVERALILALKLRCRINERSVFARKNYFYPDLPKGYQISQFDLPLAEYGVLPYWHKGEKRSARIRRIHLEEDTAKLFHLPDGSAALDYNRSGIPLIEIVSEPDFSDGAECVSYLGELRNILQRMEVSSAEMSEGNFRCEPNISVRPVGDSELRTKTEVKNLNSFTTLRRAVESETERQIKVYEGGGAIHQATLRYDETFGATVEMRRKENADDYRYFDDPDIPPLYVTEQMLATAHEGIKRSTFEIREMMVELDGLNHQDAATIAEDITLHRFYRFAVKYGHPAREVAKWVTGDFVKLLREGALKIEPDALTRLISLQLDGSLTLPQAREVFAEIYATGKEVAAVVTEKGFDQREEIDYEGLCSEVIAQNPDIVGDIMGGKPAALQVLVGQMMKKTKGSASPEQCRAVFRRQLGLEEA